MNGTYPPGGTSRSRPSTQWELLSLGCKGSKGGVLKISVTVHGRDATPPRTLVFILIIISLGMCHFWNFGIGTYCIHKCLHRRNGYQKSVFFLEQPVFQVITAAVAEMCW